MTKDTGGPVEDRNYTYESGYEFTEVPETKRINRDTA